MDTVTASLLGRVTNWTYLVMALVTQDELLAPIGFFERSKGVSHDQLVGLSQLRQAGKEIKTGRDWSLPHVAVVVGSNICLHP